MAIVMLVVLVLSIALMLISERVLLKTAYRRHMFDSHSERKIHTGDVPRLGGVLFLPAAVIVIVLLLIVSVLFDTVDLARAFNSGSAKVIMGLTGAVILFVFGLFDDIKGIRYREKFIAQFLAGLLLCLSGIWINNLYGFCGIYNLPEWVGYPLTIFAVIFVTNAMNFIDGIDGLSGSLFVLMFAYYFVLFYTGGYWLHAMLSISLVGVVLPFLWFNVYGTSERHTKVFMGDTGALVLGFVATVFGIVALRGHYAFSGAHPMALAFAVLLVPCMDVVRVVVHRVRNGATPFNPDKNHLHHKLLAVGLSQSASRMAIVTLAIVLAVATVGLSMIMNINLVFVIVVAVFYGFNIYLAKRMKSSRTGTDSSVKREN